MREIFRRLRPWFQALSFGFFVYLLIRTAFPLESRIPVDLYLRLDPFLGLISLLAEREFIVRMLPSLGVLMLVVLLGNFFCGWFCPLGATIDFFDRLLFRQRKGVKPPAEQALRRLRYGIFLFALAAGLAGWQLMFLLDPISLITRTMVVALWPPLVHLSNQSLPLLQTVWPGASALSAAAPQPVFQLNLLIFAFFAGILSLGVIRRRFWCRYLCPLGTLFALTSRLRLFRRQVSDGCTACGKCVRDCPVGAIPADQPEGTRQGDCIACLRCADCPPAAVSFGLALPRRQSAPGLSLSRRYVAGALFFGALTALLVKVNPLQSATARRNQRLIRPPGALPEAAFVRTCTGCGQCLKVCPNNALQPTLFEAGLAGVYTPRLVPRIGYCEEQCNFCGQVCPTSAIRPLPVEEKRQVQIGIAHIDQSRCIAYDNGRICLVCNEQCSYHAVVIDDRKRPIVKTDLCTGCGICENKCPVEGESAIIVYGNGGQTKLAPESSPGAEKG